jgi:DNA repair protein RadA/Sms
MQAAKSKNIAIFVIGHITKDGNIAGPRILEHMVDVVLYFEGDERSGIRILRSFKNRFGATNEVGLFEMGKRGLVGVKNIQKQLLSNSSQSGSVLSISIEGNRPILIEVQALVAEGHTNPRRSTNGYEYNKLIILLALLEKKLGVPINKYDVFVNIAGGIRVTEPSADLAVIAAILSSLYDRKIGKNVVFLGEVSLVGDIRGVTNIEGRLKEAASIGIEKAIIAKTGVSISIDGIETIEIGDISKVVHWIQK